MDRLAVPTAAAPMLLLVANASTQQRPQPMPTPTGHLAVGAKWHAVCLLSRTLPATTPRTPLLN
jgi:hypothetical protein